MALRMSTLFLRTLREDPADAELPSHRLLVRAGYIRRVAPGIYTWLPLGLRVLRNVERIVREEMDAIGAQELSFPALLPREPYEATGRWTEYGDNIFRLKDRKGADYLLGPTHEEMFTLTVKDLYSSYKDLPLSIYQIQTKYRDEARPRAGLLRGREFVMKDSYSFDVDDAGLEASYELHRDAYIRIFDRLGLDYVIVAAMSGAMGGSRSRGVPRDRRERRGHLRAVHALRLRRERRGRAGAGPRRGAVRRDARRPRRGHPRHPHHRDAGEPPQRGVPARGPSLGGRRHPQERHRHAGAPRRHPRAARHRPARRPRRRREAARGPGAPRRGRRRSTRRRSPPTRRWSRATSAPGRSARRATPRSATCSTPASSRAPAGSPAPTSRAGTSSTSSPAATSPATAPSRPPRSAPATSARAAARASSRRPVASRWATSSPSAASSPTPSA